jgi:hypothetical protein
MSELRSALHTRPEDCDDAANQLIADAGSGTEM